MTDTEARTAAELRSEIESPLRLTRLHMAASDLCIAHKHLKRLRPEESAALLREMLLLALRHADRWVATACHLKGEGPDGPTASEEWLSGPVAFIRNLRLLAESLERIAAAGDEAVSAFGHLPTRRGGAGQWQIDVFPASGYDAALREGCTATIRLRRADVKRARPWFEPRSAFHEDDDRDDDGSWQVALVLGASGVSSVAPMDVLYKTFVQRRACLLKMHPAAATMGPVIEDIMRPLIDRGFLHVVYGGAGTGAFLCQHPCVSEVHVTGSSETYQSVVWGAPGSERDARIAAGTPMFDKPVTCTLGNVTPVIIVPGEYAADELSAIVTDMTTMLAAGSGHDGGAPQVIVTSAAWAQRDQFLLALKEQLKAIPERRAWHPGTRERYDRALSGKTGLLWTSRGHTEGTTSLPWAVISQLDPAAEDDTLFMHEASCGVIGEVALGFVDPAVFLRGAVAFCNDRLHGTLCAGIMVDRRSLSDRVVVDALELAIDDLRYGTVAVNQRPSLGYVLACTPWGAHSGGSASNPQSGIGLTHNAFMIDGIEKCVIRGPLAVSPAPVWCRGSRNAYRIGRLLAAFEARPSWAKLPRLALAGLRG